MAEIRYGDLVPIGGTATIQGIGTQPGPGGGDGWQIAATLPAARLPAGTGRYAIIVTGKVGNIRVSGATPQRGVVQVCLGLDTGTRSPVHKVNIPAREQLGVLEGIPFMFVMMMNTAPSISDPVFGGSFNNASGAQWCIWARTYWNGDTPAYAVEFDVADVTWLWWDTNRIPSTDQLTEHYFPAAPVSLTTTLTGLYLNANSPGLTNEKWLHFMCVTYEPRQFNALAPRFDFGWSSSAGSFSGYTPVVGTNGRWGQMRALPAPGATEQAQMSNGVFWYQQRPSGVMQPGFRGADRSGGTPTRVSRFCYVGVRLDNLLDVLQRTETEVANATCNLVTTPPFPTVYVPLERPATGTVSLPCVMATGIVQTTGVQSHDLVLSTNRDRYLDFVEMCAQVDGGRFEGVSLFGLSAIGFSPTEPDIQYRAIFLGGLNAQPVSLNVRDISIVSFYFVRDPEILPHVPPSVGSPVLLVPGREAPDPGDLQDLPVQPDIQMPEDAEVEMARIQGVNGYVRTWPLFARVRRMWALSWSRLSESQSATLYTFLRDNPAFAFTPLRDNEVSVVQLERPTRRQVSGQVYSVQVRVAELLFTG